MDKENKFDKKKYDEQYRKEHYKQCKLWIKPDTAQKIADYCKSMGISKNKLFIESVLYCIENGVFIAGAVDGDLDADIIYSDTDIQQP